MKHSNVFPKSASEFSPSYITGGITLQQYAAIALKVPESGIDWLDAMIEKSLQNDRKASVKETKPVPDEEGWIIWHGHSDKRNSHPPYELTGSFEYKLRDGYIGSSGYPERLDWSIEDVGFDIVAYRPKP